MQPQISVIVPVYNVEKYLDRCVQSIVDQTYTNLQIILVDDGSTDGCPAACDRWAQKDCRIRVIHKENGGLSDARNAGVAIATGEYIGFADSDDRLDLRFFEVLTEQLERTGSDICSCHAIAFSEDTMPIPRDIGKTAVYTTEEAMHALITDRLPQTVWNKLYKRHLLEGIAFPVGKLHEDAFWSDQIIARAKRVAVVDFAGYHYFQRPDSIMGKGYSRSNLDGVEAKVCRLKLLQAQFPRLVSPGRIGLTFFCLYHGQKALTFLDQKERLCASADLEQILRCHRLTREDKKQLSFTGRIWYLLLRVSFPLTCRIRNGLKIGL